MKSRCWQVEKRGRFITNMEVADFVTVAVDTGDDRIKSSCMVVVEADDEGTYDRGSPTLKLVHQLSNTCDPIMNLKVPASRIIGGYTIKDGQIVPNLNHSEIIEAVFSRTRVTVGIMTAAKLVSAVERLSATTVHAFVAQPASKRDHLVLIPACR